MLARFELESPPKSVLEELALHLWAALSNEAELDPTNARRQLVEALGTERVVELLFDKVAVGLHRVIVKVVDFEAAQKERLGLGKATAVLEKDGVSKERRRVTRIDIKSTSIVKVSTLY